MGDLTKNFSSWEFECRCGHFHPENGRRDECINPQFVEILQKLREYFARPINILSGYRCPLHKLTRSRPESKHALGYAADIVVAGVRPVSVASQVYEEFFPENISGLGINWERGTVHVDARALEDAAVWKYRHGRAETIRTDPRVAIMNMKLLETAAYG